MWYFKQLNYIIGKLVQRPYLSLFVAIGFKFVCFEEAHVNEE